MQPGWLLSPWWSFPSSALSWKGQEVERCILPLCQPDFVCVDSRRAVNFISDLCVMTWISASSWSMSASLWSTMLTFLFTQRCRVDLQTLANWCISMHEEHLLPNAGQSSFCGAWHRPQYMHALSRTVAELACCLTALTSCWPETSLLYLSALSWIWQSWTALWRVRSLSFSSCFRKASDDTPQTVLSRMKESFKVPNSQVSARIFNAVIKFWTVPMPPETWCWTCVVQWSH